MSKKIRQEFEKKTGSFAVEKSGDTIFNINENYLKWVEAKADQNNDLINAIIPIAEIIKLQLGSFQYVNEPDINPDSHLGKITITVQDARCIYNALIKAGIPGIK